MSNLLAIDTSADLCSVCLLVTSANRNRKFVRSEAAARSHAQRILPLVREVLDEAGIELADVDLIAFGRGPGSFTGLRIAAGIVQGLAFGQNIPTLGISNLAAIAHYSLAQNTKDKYCLALIDARMNEVYWGVYGSNEEDELTLIGEERVSSPKQVVLPDSLEDFVVSGSGLGYQSEMPVLDDIARQALENFIPAVSIAELAMGRQSDKELLPAEKAAPIYIRDEVTWKKLPGRD